MTCSEQNFVQSQHMYGLLIAIANKSIMPSINDCDSAWKEYLTRINALAKMSAQIQIENNPSTDANAS